MLSSSSGGSAARSLARQFHASVMPRYNRHTTAALFVEPGRESAMEVTRNCAEPSNDQPPVPRPRSWTFAALTAPVGNGAGEGAGGQQRLVVRAAAEGHDRVRHWSSVPERAGAAARGARR